MRIDTSLRLVTEDWLLALDPVEVMRRNGYTADPWQIELLEARDTRVFVLSPRQKGKSTVSAAKVLHRMLFVPGTEALIVSKSLNQAREWMKRLKELYRPFSGRWPATSDTAGSVTLANLSRCISVPHGDASRGYSPTILVIDEVGFIDDDDIGIVLPTVDATHGDIIALTTPPPAKAGRRWARAVWEAGKGWRRINVTADLCPRLVIDPEDEERLRNELGEARYLREYKGQFFDLDDPSNPKLASREASARLRARLAGSAPDADDEIPLARAS